MKYWLYELSVIWLKSNYDYVLTFDENNLKWSQISRIVQWRWSNEDGENTKLLLDQLQHSISPRNYHLHCGNRFLSKNNTNLLKVKLHITHDPTLPLYSYDWKSSPLVLSVSYAHPHTGYYHLARNALSYNRCICD